MPCAAIGISLYFESPEITPCCFSELRKILAGDVAGWGTTGLLAFFCSEENKLVSVKIRTRFPLKCLSLRSGWFKTTLGVFEWELSPRIALVKVESLPETASLTKYDRKWLYVLLLCVLNYGEQEIGELSHIQRMENKMPQLFCSGKDNS